MTENALGGAKSTQIVLVCTPDIYTEFGHKMAMHNKFHFLFYYNNNTSIYHKKPFITYDELLLSEIVKPYN